LLAQFVLLGHKLIILFLKFANFVDSSCQFLIEIGVLRFVRKL
jgi:hypothetical protein